MEEYIIGGLIGGKVEYGLLNWQGLNPVCCTLESIVKMWSKGGKYCKDVV